MRGKPFSRSRRIEPILQEQKGQDVNAGTMWNEIAPIVAARRGERHPDDLEIFGAVGVGADNQSRSAVESRMVFDFVLDAGFARGNERQLGLGRSEIDEPDFRGFVIVRRYVAEMSRCVAAD